MSNMEIKDNLEIKGMEVWVPLKYGAVCLCGFQHKPGPKSTNETAHNEDCSQAAGLTVRIVSRQLIQKSSKRIQVSCTL
jgi:hypothetical protein